MKKTNSTTPNAATKSEPSKLKNEFDGGLHMNNEHLNTIVNFLDNNTTFSYTVRNSEISITQKEDKKKITFTIDKIEKIIDRRDFDGSEFIQINFTDESKALVTQHLIGFKPLNVTGIELGKIPKVVTTVDLRSIVTAVDEIICGDEAQQSSELVVLKKVYQSILLGAEGVGFDMAAERTWYIRNMLNSKAAAA